MPLEFVCFFLKKKYSENIFSFPTSTFFFSAPTIEGACFYTVHSECVCVYYECTVSVYITTYSKAFSQHCTLTFGLFKPTHGLWVVFFAAGHNERRYSLVLRAPLTVWCTGALSPQRAAVRVPHHWPDGTPGQTAHFSLLIIYYFNWCQLYPLLFLEMEEFEIWNYKLNVIELKLLFQCYAWREEKVTLTDEKLFLQQTGRVVFF